MWVVLETELVGHGIEIDTVANQLRLPREKQENLQTALRYWTGHEHSQGPRRSGSKLELLSLIGLLNHAAKVVQPGRAFLRNLINVSTTVDSLDHRVHLTRDLAWWHTFLKNWNGVSVLPRPPQHTTSLPTHLGGGVVGQHIETSGFSCHCPSHWSRITIAPKEMAPIVIAVALWGPQWAGSRVCARCDNAAVVCAINKNSARDPTLSRLLRLLALLWAVYDITLTARHLPRVQNTSADALSRNRLHTFLSLNPQASPMPTVIAPSLQELVFNSHLRSTSPTWIRKWRDTWASA